MYKEIISKLKEDKYETISEGKANLRLYLNDPLILKQLTQTDTVKEHGMVIELPIPVELSGKVVLGKTEDGKLHYFFTHDNPSFIPVFFDLQVKKLHRL